MKFFRIAFFAAVLMLGCHGFSMAQSKLNPYALVRIYESEIEQYNRIIISYEDGNTETIQLPAMAGFNSKKDNIAEINGLILKILNQMVNKGYKVIAVTTNNGMTTYTMEKVE